MLGRVDFWVGLVVGVGAYYGYLWWKQRKATAQ